MRYLTSGPPSTRQGGLKEANRGASAAKEREGEMSVTSVGGGVATRPDLCGVRWAGYMCGGWFEYGGFQILRGHLVDMRGAG